MIGFYIFTYLSVGVGIALKTNSNKPKASIIFLFPIYLLMWLIRDIRRELD